MDSQQSEHKQGAPGLKALLSLAWPVILARATQAVIGFSDALMVAPLGEQSLAAVTTGSLNVFALIVLPMGAAFIIQSFVAQLRGRGELAATRRYGWYGLGLAGAFGLLGALCIPLVPHGLGLIGYEANVEALMVTYVSIRLLSVAGAVGVEALGNWYGGLGNTRPAMIVGLGTMVVNVALNFVLIEPRFGLPGYGVTGAAYASVIATWFGFGLLLIGFLRGMGYEQSQARLVLKWHEFVRVLRFGLPNGANWFMEFAAFVLFINVVVGHLGTTVLAAFNVVIQINSMSFMPAFGLSSAGAILVGEAIGRRAHEQVGRIVRLTAIVAVMWMGSVGLIYFTFPHELMSVFGDEASEGRFVAIGATMLALSAIWQLFDALAMTFGEALRAAGDTIWCMVARLLFAWLVFTPAAWAAVVLFDGGVTTVMVALVVYLAGLALIFGLRFASGRWRDIELIETEPTV